MRWYIERVNTLSKMFVSVGDHNSICLLRLEFLYSHKSLEVNIMNILQVLCYFKDNKK